MKTPGVTEETSMDAVEMARLPVAELVKQANELKRVMTTLSPVVEYMANYTDVVEALVLRVVDQDLDLGERKAKEKVRGGPANHLGVVDRERLRRGVYPAYPEIRGAAQDALARLANVMRGPLTEQSTEWSHADLDAQGAVVWSSSLDPLTDPWRVGSILHEVSNFVFDTAELNDAREQAVRALVRVIDAVRDASPMSIR